MYLPRNVKKINVFFENLKRGGFNITKKKIGKRSLYSTLKSNRNIIRFEALFKIVKGSLKEYETAEGNLITVYTLTPAEIIKEKIDAYLNGLKIRDLYDIFFLLRYVKDKKEIAEDLKLLVRKFKKPIDEQELKVLIIEGLVPDVENMLEYIKRVL